MAALSPRESAALISQLAEDVHISTDGVKKAADMIGKEFIQKKYDLKTWKEHELHPKLIDSSAVEWIFLTDTLNFSFWSECGTEYVVTYKDKSYTGYWSLCAAINRAIEEGFPVLSAEYYAGISLQDLKHILRSDSGVEMPLIQERHNVLREAGKCLIEKFNGSFLNCISACEKSAEKLLNLIVENFPSYRDEAQVEGHKVSFYKRAQILIGDIWACCEGTSYGAFHDIDSITMFADYRIPQALVYLGVLKYSERLNEKLKGDILFESGERLEVEIRGCTIWAVELICQELNQRAEREIKFYGLKVNPILVDNFLWDYRREHAAEMSDIPFHKIRCIYY